MAHIVIKRGVVVPRQFTGKDGTKYHFNEQPAALVKDGEDFPHPFSVPLGDDQPPYPPGNYTLDLSGFQVNQFNGLELKRRFSLLPVQIEAPAAPSK